MAGRVQAWCSADDRRCAAGVVAWLGVRLVRYLKGNLRLNRNEA